MIKKTLILLNIVFVLISCQKNQQVIINGNILNGLGYEKLYLSEYNLTYEKLVDSTEISSSGKFKFKTKTISPQLYKLFVNNNQFIWLFTSPGEKINIQINALKFSTDYQINGSIFSNQVKELMDTLFVNRKKLDSLFNLSMLANIQNNRKLSLSIDKQYNDIIQQQRNYSIHFLLNHIHSPASIIALYQQLNDSLYVFYKPTDLQYIKIISDTLIKYYPESKLVKSFYSERNRMLAAYQTIQKRNKSFVSQTIEQKNFPEIKLPSIQGDTIVLSESFTKIALLVFWTPLDRDCQIAMNSFAHLFQKYNSKGLALITVALFDDKGFWSNYIQKLNIPGIHLIDELGLRSIAARTYFVQNLPSTFLVSKNGIISRDYFGDNLEKLIVQSLNQ